MLLTEAVPLLVSATLLASVVFVLLSMNVTVPEVTGVSLLVTVAVNVIGFPVNTGFGNEVTAVVVPEPELSVKFKHQPVRLIGSPPLGL